MTRLKVLTTPSGFYDLAVAVSSQAKALAAWGIRQNLFAQGMARVATDQATVRAALAKPGVVLRRPLGTQKPFSEEPSLPKVRGGKQREKSAQTQGGEGDRGRAQGPAKILARLRLKMRRRR